MEKFTFELTKNEITALGQLIDVAIKSSGLQGARMAVPLVEKLEKAVMVSPATEPSETVENIK